MAHTEAGKRTGPEKWTRANKIAMVTAIAALSTAGAPYVQRVVHSIWQAPQAAINYVLPTASNGKRDQCSTVFTAGGAAKRIPANDDLWVAVRSHQGLWYPVARISSGTWTSRGAIKTSQVNYPVSIDVILLSDANDGQFIRYMSQRETIKGNVNQGFSSLPLGNEVLSVDSLTNWGAECRFPIAIPPAGTQSPPTGLPVPVKLSPSPSATSRPGTLYPSAPAS
jgi:hypothetical protein